MFDPAEILNGRVLIVDDEPANVRLLERLLSGAGYTSVTSTMEPRQVCELHRTHRYDLIILDLKMPGMDGFQVMRALKDVETEGYLPVLALSAHPDHKLRALQAGAKDFISNPFDQVEMLTRIHNMLELRLLLRESRSRLEGMEERFHLLVEGVKDYAILLLDPRGLVLTWNEGARRLQGYAEGDIVGRSIECFYTPEDLAAGKPAELLRMAAATGRAEDEGWRVRKDGTRFEADVVLTAVRHSTGELVGFAKVTRDMTERHELERRLLQAQKMEAIGRLAGGVAHDFNNILGVIGGFGELAQRQLPPDHPVQGRLEQILRASGKAAELTRQMLAFSRQQVMHPRALDLNAVIEGTQKMLARLIGEDIEVVLRLSPGLGTILADSTQLDQVLMNLAVNARDAMPQGGTLSFETANVEVDEDYVRRHVAGRPGSYVMLAVSDTGIGMDEETRSHVFEPFYTTKPEGKGTGLGLATVYGIVKQSGGFIWLYTEPRRGATFKIYLPRVDSAREAEAPATTAELPRGTETILVVEDQEALREMIREVLEQQGYTVLTAAEGNTALELARRQKSPLHLILTDVVLPGINGRELAARVKAERPGIRALYMSGYTNQTVSHRGMLATDGTLVEKPFTATSLTQAVRKALDQQVAE